ncbi:MAG TPA: VOC family protein, partial [Acidothermaceae bacterium]
SLFIIRNGPSQYREEVSMIVGYDHVQVAIPSGAEDVAREYYGGLLGMTELPKPAPLAARGGCWFTAGAAVLHLGVEADFRPARKAHPAFVVEDLDALERTLQAAGFGTTSANDEIPDLRRFHTFDPFGNRLEFQQA